MTSKTGLIAFTAFLACLTGCANQMAGGNYYGRQLCYDGSVSAHCPLTPDSSWMWTPK